MLCGEPWRKVRKHGRLAARDEPFDPSLYLAAGQEDPAAAGQAAEPDIRAEAHDAPFRAATWVRLAQLHDIVETELKDHRLPAVTRRASTRKTSPGVRGAPGSMLYTARRPSMACAIVISSAYSRSPPIGSPLAMRVT